MSQGVYVVGEGWKSEKNAQLMFQTGRYVWSANRKRMKRVKGKPKLRDFSARHGEYLTEHKREDWAKALVSDVRGSVERARAHSK